MCQGFAVLSRALALLDFTQLSVRGDCAGRLSTLCFGVPRKMGTLVNLLSQIAGASGLVAGPV